MQEKQYIKDKVTVVIPVYNEERFLRQALESVVHQVDCVILGDNASTDGTEDICREFAEKYDHIVYFQNENNLGSVANYIKCYEYVETEYVFHMGGHDMIPPDYVKALKKTLQDKGDKNTAGSIAPTQVFDDQNPTLLLDDYLEFRSEWQNENPFERAAHFVFSGHPCNILFGLYRSSVLLPIVETRCLPIAGCDHVFLFSILLQGKLIYCSDTSFLRRDVHANCLPNCNKDKSAYMKRIQGNLESASYKYDRQPMVREMLRDFSTHHSPFVTDSQKWKIFVKLERSLQKQMGISKIEDDLAIIRNCHGYRLALFWEKFREFRSFFFSIHRGKDKVRIKICGPSFSFRVKKSPITE